MMPQKKPPENSGGLRGNKKGKNEKVYFYCLISAKPSQNFNQKEK